MFTECIHTTDVLPQETSFQIGVLQINQEYVSASVYFFHLELSCFFHNFVFSDPPLTARSKKRFEILLLNKLLEISSW